VNFDRVCVDASLALAWLIPWQGNPQADALRREWHENSVEMVGPPMFHAEVTSVLREEVFFKRMAPEEGQEAFLIYATIPVRIVDSPTIYRRAWELAIDYNQRRTYDMQYLAVAELEDCEFWTADRILANSLKGKNKRIKLVGDYSQKGTQ
jgi:predicted nucleic acid-binding protein